MTAPIFVFGSNLAGRHGKGAALCARKEHGAVYGEGVGRTGDSYAIPTKDENLNVLSLAEIVPYIIEFMVYSANNPHLEFYVTKVGCGLAGYSEDDMKPLFEPCPSNCQLPEGWRD